MSDRPFCELRTANPTDRITLRAVRVNAHLVGMSARTVTEQLFVNEEPKAVEAVYTFPLPDEGAVCAFEVVVADRVLTGRVEEREQAMETYENAINQGNGAFLLEQERPDIFTVRVGNLLPKQAVLVRLTTVTPLEVVDNAIRFALPTIVAPRYVPGGSFDELECVAEIDSDAINPPHVLSVPYGLTLAVHVDLGRKVQAIASPSHAIHTVFNENSQYKITFAGGMTDMDRDVVIEMQLAREVAPAVQVGTGPDGAKYLAISFMPEFEVQDLVRREAAEVVFVVDCSGSMQGESIAQAKAALELCLRSLSLGDRFNICCFGSGYQLMSPMPLVYSDATLKQSLKYVAAIDANLGGTELHAPLANVLATPTKSVRDVILLSDGEISNEDAVMRLVRAHKDHNRIFAFGIGSAPSASLIRGLARSSGGAAEFIGANENIADKVLRTFSRLASPALHDVEVDFDLAEVTLASPHLPPVFDGDMLTIYARAVGYVPKTVTLKAKSAAGQQRWRAALAEPRGDESTIATTWARKMIQHLEAEPHDHRSRLLELSKRFNLVCSLTAFVAVEHRSIEERNDGRPELRRMPVQLAHGWHDLVGSAFAAGAPAMGAAALHMDCDITSLACEESTMDSTMDRTIDRLCDSAAPRPAKRRKGVVARFFSRPHAEAAAPAPAQPAYFSPLQELLSLQTAEGWFDLSATSKVVNELLDKASPIVRMKRGTHQPTVEESREHWTRTVLNVLCVGFKADEAIWKAAFEKAIRYLAKASGQTIAQVRKSIDDALATN